MTCAPHYIRVATQQKLSMPVPYTTAIVKWQMVEDAWQATVSVLFPYRRGFRMRFLPIAAEIFANRASKKFISNHLFTEIRNPSLLKVNAAHAIQNAMQRMSSKSLFYQRDYLHQEPYCIYKPNNGTEKPTNQLLAVSN